MTDVLLVTCAELPDGEVGGALIVDELAARGVSARWVVWDDPAVDWSAGRLAVVRSPWDYDSRRDEFLDWARAVESRTTLVNCADVIAWNTDKIYLLDLLDAGLPVVPTLAAEDEGELPPAIASFESAVVKPRVGAGGRGVVVFDGRPGGPEGLDESQLLPGPWVVQPLVETIHTEGELSVFVLGGRAVSQVRKVPGGGEIRVHEEYGGRTTEVPLTEEAADLALRTVEAAVKVLGSALPYARVDLMRLDDGTLAVSELEVTEPGLYLDVVPGNASEFAKTLADLLGCEA
ncbi:MAG: ATP-grasp domain-containing protein [Nocardioidaceae bacterium]